jgi:hypothetical protein
MESRFDKCIRKAVAEEIEAVDMLGIRRCLEKDWAVFTCILRRHRATIPVTSEPHLRKN